MKKYLGLILLQYFRLLARIKLAQWHPTIIGVTGSAGKTSTMVAVAAILTNTRVVKTSEKANSESGIPLNILGLYPRSYSISDWIGLAIMAIPAVFRPPDSADTYIVELGIDGPTIPKNMSYLLSILQPNVGIFTTVNTIHGQHFESWLQTCGVVPNRANVLKAIAKEKGKLIATMPKSGTIILNADEPLIAKLAKKTPAKMMTFGTNSKATIKLSQTVTNGNGTIFHFKFREEQVQVNFPNYLLPPHFGMSFAAALCVGLRFGLSFSDSCKKLEKNFTLPPGRSNIIAGKHGTTILDSSYNSSPKPLIDSLRLLQKMPGRRKLALLGDMRELGSASASEHEQAGAVASKICDAVFLLGPAMQAHVLPLFQKQHKPAFVCSSAVDAAKKLNEYLRAGDVLLVKGSQNTLLLEIAVERLMRHPDQAEKLLCRRGEFWDKERKKLI